jgi:hypothetical protein
MAQCNKLAWRHAHLYGCLLAASAIAGCTGATQSSSSSNSNTPPSTSGVTVKVSPSGATVRAGATQALSAVITGSSNTAVAWQVNGVSGGNTATGTISASGLYAAPNIVPNPNTVIVRAVSSADATASDTSNLTLENPLPVLANIAPTSVPAGAFAITVNGSGFVSGAQVLLAGAPLTTTFVSASQLTASGIEASAGTFSIAVTNPNPGSATSASQTLQVTSGGGGTPPSPSCSGMSLGQGGSLNGFVPFPGDNPWNQDISSAPVDANSSAILILLAAPSACIRISAQASTTDRALASRT